jgi:DNA-binding HxlR family transcriptional regulator
VLDRGRITIGELEELCSGTPRRTLQRDLKALVDKGLLVRSGSTNRHEYRPREVGG